MSSVTLSCSDAQKIASSVMLAKGLTMTQREEIISNLQETVSECPLTTKESKK
jgi:hypothetical protein